ncbi:hypothetical protein Tco_0992937 [Tanacetum coccineum]|uniref:Uncharacterized protein n=1 Tax=Tanacetum coccineum TaxID=301880 RepID=A0ABQ5F3I1_9ASTR
MHQEEHLDSDVESVIDDNTISYHQYQLDNEVQDVPTEVSSAPPGEISMITILDDLRTQLDRHLKVNQEQSLVNDSLRAELARRKQEMVSLERNKVKHDLDQTIIQRNKRNAELEEENVLLKSKLSQNVESINSLKNESKKVVSEKKVLEDKYLEEIVCLKSANKVATEILQRFQQPTQTIQFQCNDPPPKRANWGETTPMPKKKQLLFPGTPSYLQIDPHRNHQLLQNNKPNVPINLSTEPEPATESRKPMPKSHTRIMEPIVEPLELTSSVSSSSKVTMISRFNDCKLSDRKAGSNGISGIFEC